ncbi:TadE/TadG family type IV pilus assembly protein [Paenibacillus woosongensis]|uniref:Uncharacterized protein n=1 Tax=Paenibacillus woosongensis TaxID=307580 RepID=A0A7X2YZF3_9BACL|nr:hypothetical protein [Paenibacillus woosongensis]MUG44036.1 hypothetical protein [Paenibacillus woosongensis]
MLDKRRSEQGAVTVFLIVIFAAVFAFVAIFIDFARMSALQARTEVLAHSAARSVLSAYDKQLLEKYGLFAFGETDENYLMSKVLQDNFQLAMRSDNLPIMEAQLDSSSVELLRPLGHYSVFRRQIREDMKYKAPIDFAIEVVNKFKPMAQIMKEASNTVDLLSKLQRLYDQREDKLDQLLSAQKQAASSAKGYTDRLARRNYTYIPDHLLGSPIHLIADAASQYNDYLAKAEEDRDREASERVYSDLLADYRYDTGRAFNALSQADQEAAVQHAQQLIAARALLEEVRGINEQMRQVIKESESRPAQHGYDSVSRGLSIGGDEAASGESEIAEIRGRSENLLLQASLLMDLEAGIEAQEASFNSAHQAVASLLSSSSDMGTASSGSASGFKSKTMQASREIDRYLRTYSDSGSGNALQQIQAKVEAHRSSDAQRKQTEQQAAAELKHAFSLLRQIEELKNKMGEHQKQFDVLRSYFDNNRALNQDHSAAEAGQGIRGRSPDPYETGEQAMGGMDVLYASLSEMMSGITDNGYQTEYVVSYFDFFDVSTLKELMEGRSDKLDAMVEQFAPQRQEVEYILYGFHNPAGNVAAAYGEIFTMRLAIRTMEGLIKHASKVNPLLILASALLYGVVEAVKDMVRLCQKGGLQLSDYLRVELTYRDHLRLFLLLHGTSDRRLSRMLSVVRLNTGINPDERATYIQGEVTVALPLWFLPGVSKAIGSAGALQGRVEGSRYYAVKQAHYSY